MNTQTALTTHTYLDKRGNSIKKPKIDTEAVLEAYSYLITKTKGKLSERLLKLAFTDKSKAFTKILLDTGYMKMKSDLKTLSIKMEDGTTKYVTIPRIYITDNKVREVKTNRYLDKLWLKLEKRGSEYKWLLDNIKSTLDKTTLNGEKIGTDIKYVRGRYYGPHTSMPKEIRRTLKIDGHRTLSLDIRSSVFQLLNINNIEGISPITLEEVDTLKIIYGKEELLKQVFCNTHQQNVKLDKYPFFSSLREFKNRYGYKTVFYIYQQCETHLMTNIYESLALNKIDFLPMHDALIFKYMDYSTVMDIVGDLTKTSFKIER